MDPASLSFAVVSFFKDVYLVSKFVYKAGMSAAYYREEQHDILRRFRQQTLSLKIFWYVLVDSKGDLIPDERLNQLWLERIKGILQDIQKSLAQYQPLALADDEYHLHNAYLGDSKTAPMTEFPLEIYLIEKPKQSSKLISDIKSLFKGPLLQRDAWRWSLFQKSELERVLQHYTFHTQELVGLFPQLLACSHYLQRPDIRSTLLRHDAGVSAVEPHYKLKWITSGEMESLDDQDVVDLSLPMGSSNHARIFEELKYSVDDEQVHQLARLLWTAGSSNLGTLPFKGYSREADGRFKFDFEFPASVSDRAPRSLHDLIRDATAPGSRASLPDRFRIATFITQAISAFHASGWVHKSIRSHSLKFFYDDDNDQLDLSSCYLTDFELSRPESGITMLEADHDKQRNLYRHPDRQGQPTSKFTQVHDVYALGVVLLEIGVWETASTMYQDNPGNSLSPKSVRKLLVRHAERRLGHHMGPAYKKAVLACLGDDWGSVRGEGHFAAQFEEVVVRNVNIHKLV